MDRSSAPLIFFQEERSGLIKPGLFCCVDISPLRCFVFFLSYGYNRSCLNNVFELLKMYEGIIYVESLE